MVNNPSPGLRASACYVVSICSFSNGCNFVQAKSAKSRALKKAAKAAANSKKRKATIEETANGTNGQLAEVRYLKSGAVFVTLSVVCDL